MQALKARISIKSKPSDVFRALTDFDSYAKWNPWLKDVQGEAKEGARVLVQPDLISLMGYHLRYHLVKIQPKDFLRWQEEGWFDFLIRAVREYQVYTKLGGSAIYSIHLNFEGPLAPVVSLFYGTAVRRGLRREAEALKKYCEATFPLVLSDSHTDLAENEYVNLDEVFVDE